MSVVVEIPLALGAVAAMLDGKTPELVEAELRARAVLDTGSALVTLETALVITGTSRETCAVVAGAREVGTRAGVGVGRTTLLAVRRDGNATVLAGLCVELDIARRSWEEGKREKLFFFVVSIFRRHLFFFDRTRSTLFSRRLDASQLLSRTVFQFLVTDFR